MTLHSTGGTGNMWEVSSRVAILGLLVTAFVWSLRQSGRRALAELVTEKVGLPDEAAEWMLPRATREPPWGCGLPLFLIATIVTLAMAGPWQRAADLTIVALVAAEICYRLGDAVANLRGNVPALLAELANAAERRAAAFEAAGDTAQSKSALELAQWIRTLCQHVPHLTRATLEGYYTRRQVATIIENRFLEGSSDDYEIRRWLKSPTTALYADPREDQRVALLEDARHVVQPLEEGLQEGRGSTVDETRLRAIVDQLRAGPGAG